MAWPVASAQLALAPLASHVPRLVEYDRRTGRLLNLKTFISETFSSSQPSGAPTWRFGYDHVACTSRITCQRLAGWLRFFFCLHMFVVFEGKATPLGIDPARIPVYNSQPSSNFNILPELAAELAN